MFQLTYNMTTGSMQASLRHLSLTFHNFCFSACWFFNLCDFFINQFEDMHSKPREICSDRRTRYFTYRDMKICVQYFVFLWFAYLLKIRMSMAKIATSMIKLVTICLKPNKLSTLKRSYCIC